MTAKYRLVLLSLFFVINVFVLSPPTNAQARSVYWEQWDVFINNVDTSENKFDVRYEYDVFFTGTFTFGSIVVEDSRLTSLENIRISENGRALSVGCQEQPGTFCVSQVQEGISLRYMFFQPITNGNQQFTISYTVNGALRVYEDGDQLWWSAIPEEHFGFPIRNSVVTVELPDGYAPRSGIDPVETYGVPAEVSVDGRIVRATATRVVGGNESFEIRVQYPHDPNASPPLWQSSFDDRRAFEQNVLPFLNIGSIALSLLILIGFPFGTYAYWNRRGRDPEIGPVPEYLSEPPSDLRPAVIGTLIDERADVHDIVSIFVDLAQRGYMVFEETRTEGLLFGMGAKTTFTFKRTDKPIDDLHEFEKQAMRKVFTSQNQKVRDLDDLKNEFYKIIGDLQNKLYDALYDRGFVDTRPKTTRTIWQFIARSGVIVALVIGTFSFSLIETVGAMVLCVPFALGVASLIMLIFANFMPRKTYKGAVEAAKWRAFKHYLENLKKYADVDEAATRFDEFLPYAVAFGMERQWINHFKDSKHARIPMWYFPTYQGGRYSGGYRAGTPVSQNIPLPSVNDVLPGDLARAGGGAGGLDTMSQGMSGGLNSISDGLTSMLDSAGRTFTSAPSNSSGGGFSGGGGSFGGGSSGGGSSGFG